MRRVIFFSLLCCILLVFFAQTGSCTTATINVVKNGGFEEGTSDWYWHKNTYGYYGVNEGGAAEGSKYGYLGKGSDRVYLCGDKIADIPVDTTWTEMCINISEYRGQTCYLKFITGSGSSESCTQQEVYIPPGAKYLAFYYKQSSDGNTLYLDYIRISITRDYKEIQDPSFKYEIGNNPNVGWSKHEEVNASSYSTTVTTSTEYAKYGSKSLKLSASISDGNYVLTGVRQKIELTDEDYLKFWLYMPSDAVNEAYIGVAIDNVTVWARSAKTMTWEEFAVNVKGYTGVHDVMFFAYAKNASSSSVEGYIDFVHFGEVNPVTIEGYVYDALTGLPVEGCNITATQSGGSYEATSGSDGYYNITGLVTNYEVEISASKAGYRHTPTYIVFETGGVKRIDIYLLPEGEEDIIGLVRNHVGVGVAGATVYISNTSWSANTTTNDFGYFTFDNLSNGTYHLYATHPIYHQSEKVAVEVDNTTTQYVFLTIYPYYTLTIFAKSFDGDILTNFAVSLDGGDVKSTTVGSVTFENVMAGYHTVYVSAEGYYSATKEIYVWRNMSATVFLQKMEEVTITEQGVGISYPPHHVEFVCVDMFGNPLANIQVEATPISTTTGSWNWLLNLFGIRNESITYYTNQTLNGTTDSRGAVTFVMMENVEYEVRFVNKSLGINKTIRTYPKADHYTVVLTPTTSSVVSSEDYITFNLSYEIVGDEINLSLVYSDALAQTQNLTFFVYNSTTLLYSQNFTNTSNISVSYTVPYKAGEEYMWGYSAFHSRFGEMGRSRILRIAWFLDLGISRTYCTWIAIAIILFLTAMFSFTTVKFGYVAIPIVSLIFAFIGWLPNISIIIIALCLGILAYMSKREKEVGV